MLLLRPSLALVVFVTVTSLLYPASFRHIPQRALLQPDPPQGNSSSIWVSHQVSPIWGAYAQHWTRGSPTRAFRSLTWTLLLCSASGLQPQLLLLLLQEQMRREAQQLQQQLQQPQLWGPSPLVLEPAP